MYVTVFQQLAAIRDIEAQVLDQSRIRIVRHHDLPRSQPVIPSELSSPSPTNRPSPSRRARQARQPRPGP
jgi:ribonuclease D